MSLDAYWDMYDATLARVRTEKPNTFAALKAILDAFEPPSSGQAFFPGGADDDLADALHDAGWEIAFEEGTYLYTATHPHTGAQVEHVEGDLFDQSPKPTLRDAHATTPGARIALVATLDPYTRLIPEQTGTVQSVDDAGTVHVLWDDGSTLGLIPEDDEWRPLHPRWDVNPMVQTHPQTYTDTDTEEDTP